jgi:hypothetical protein
LPLLWCIAAQAQEMDVWLYAGGGQQLNADRQHNRIIGADANLLHHRYSDIQTWSLGVSVARLNANHGEIRELTAISVYPQLALRLPHTKTLKPYFFVRALGPTYLSARGLGERKQAYSWAFQSQVGIGAFLSSTEDWTLNVSLRHYSNANFGNPNDGIDSIMVLALGHRF